MRAFNASSGAYTRHYPIYNPRHAVGTDPGPGPAPVPGTIHTAYRDGAGAGTGTGAGTGRWCRSSSPVSVPIGWSGMFVVPSTSHELL